MAATGWRGNWKGPQAFTIYSLAGTISQTWPVNGASNGHTSTLWAYTNNTGTGAFPPNTSVWFWVTGPGINGYVGSVNVAGQASGASAWRGYNWAIPNNKAGGAHTYKAIIWTYSAGGGGWKQLSPFSATRAFTIAYNAYFGEVVQTWPVYRAGTALPPIRGTASRFWDNGRNSGALTHDANTRMWFYLTGPSGFSARYIGSVQTTGQTINTNVWRTVDYAIPAGSPLGTYTYYGIFWRWNGSSWILAGPNPGLGRSFGVAADENTAVPESDLKPAELPPGGAPPPPPPGQ